MKSRFVIAAEGLTKDQEKIFIDWIKQSKLESWHWIENFWLIYDPEQSLATSQIRDKIFDIESSAKCLVMKIEEDLGWSGMGDDEAMFQWFRSVWKD